LISFSFRLVSDQFLIGSGVASVRRKLPYVYRKPKPGSSGDEVRQGRGAISNASSSKNPLDASVKRSQAGRL
jgi:hypothetical protein